jgi:hypothetical protein
MKNNKIKTKLDFKSKSIIELNSDFIKKINGGGNLILPTNPISGPHCVTII